MPGLSGIRIVGASFSAWQWAACGLVGLVLPAASWAEGRGGLAFTMYSSTVTYRLEMAWTGSDGSRHALFPTEVAGSGHVAFDSAAPFLAGSEVFRTVPQIDALRRHLRDGARAACPLRPAVEVEIALYERDRIASGVAGANDAPDRRAFERVDCGPVR